MMKRDAARHRAVIESTLRGVAWWGVLYGGNTVGAVFGRPVGGLLHFVANIRRLGGHVRGRGDQRRGGCGQLDAGSRDAWPTGCARDDERQRRFPQNLPPSALNDPLNRPRVTGPSTSPRHCPGRARLGSGSDLNPNQWEYAAHHGVRLLHHSGSVSDSAWGSAVWRVRGSWRIRPALALGWCRFCSPRASPGLLTWLPIPSRTFGRPHVLLSAAAPGTPSKSTWGAACGRSCPPRSCGARVSCLRSQPWLRRAKIPAYHCGRRLCCQHPGRYRGRSQRQPGSDPLDRHRQQTQRLLLVLSAVSALFVLVPYVWEYKSKSVAAWRGGLHGNGRAARV